MRRSSMRRQDDFTGGMIYRHSPGKLAPNECEWLENVDLTEMAYAVKRKGFRKLNVAALAGSIQGIYEHRPRDGEVHLIVMAGGKVYRWNETTDLFVEIHTGLSTSSAIRASMVPYDDWLILLNGVDTPHKYDPVTETVSALGGSPPIAAFGAVYYHHLFLSGNPTEPTRVYYSETDDAEDGYEGKNYFFNAIVDDTSRVTALYPREGELVIGKAQSITALRGMDPREFAQPQNRAAYTSERGIISHTGIIEVMKQPWYISEDGIFNLATNEEASWAVQGFFREMLAEKLGNSFSVRMKLRDQVIFWIPRKTGGIGMDTALVAHPGKGRGGLPSWSVWTGPEPTCATPGWGLILGESLYIGDANGFVYQTGAVYDDATAPVEMRLRSQWYDMEQPDQLKVLKELVGEFDVGSAADISLGYAADRGRSSSGRDLTMSGSVFITGTSETGDEIGGNVLRRRRVQLDAKGHRFRVEIESTLAQDCRIAATEVVTHPYGRRGKA
jgi:hypothetical protein